MTSEQMNMNRSGRLVILSGPSCAGKTPLVHALTRFHPDLMATLKPIVLYNSRSPRPGETDGVDYHFRSRERLEEFRDDDRFVVMEVRNDLQALDVQELTDMLREGDALFEGSPTTGRLLLTNKRLEHVDRLSVFLVPLAAEEIRELRSDDTVVLREVVTELMRRKQIRRLRRFKNGPSLADLEDVETRARSAYDELHEAASYQFVVPNHDGEDSDNWSAFGRPIGDARRAIRVLAALLRGDDTDHAEHWPPDLLP
jgi:guanylate kinase